MRNEIKGLMAVEALEPLLEYMREHGQSVLLNWGEDDNLWECSWITGGERFTGLSNRSPRASAIHCLGLVLESLS